MAPQTKNAMQYIGIILTMIGIIAGVVSAFAIQGEKVAQLEQCAVELKSNFYTTERYNSDEHKIIIQKLAEIQGMLKNRVSP